MERFWTALESVPGLALIRAEWKEKLGPDFHEAQRFLRPTENRSAVYPCPRPSGDGCPRRVVVHGPRDIVAVCNQSPRHCGTVELSESDIIIHEVNLGRLCAEISTALGLEGSPQPKVVGPHTWSLGVWVRRASDRIPAYLTMPTTQKDFRQIVTELIVGGHAPFLLLTPTSHSSDTATLDLIRKNESRYLALGEILTLSGEGKLVTEVSLAKVFGGRQSVLGGSPANVFRKQQDHWKVVYQGQEVTVKGYLGLAYIRYLLDHPGEKVPCTTVYAVAHPGEQILLDSETEILARFHLRPTSVLPERRNGCVPDFFWVRLFSSGPDLLCLQ